MFQPFSLAIFRLIMRNIGKQLHSTCVGSIQWGGQGCSGYEISHVLCRMGGVGSAIFYSRLIYDIILC